MLIFQEPFSPTQLIGFGLVWLALIVLTVDNIWQRRQLAAVEAQIRAAPDL